MPELSNSARKQGELWGCQARNWAALQEGIESDVWIRGLDALGAGPGSAFLDCGCGAGGALVEAATRGAICSGFDPSASLLTVARERNPGADLRVGELERIPWPNAEFDGALSSNSLQFTANPQLGVHEMGRVCRSGGRVAVAVWDEVATCDLGRVYEAILALFPEPPRGRGVFALSGPGALEQLFASVPDLALDGIDTVECIAEYPSLDAAVEGQMAAGATQRTVEIFGEERVREAVRLALGPLSMPAQPLRMRNQCRLAVAVKR